MAIALIIACIAFVFINGRNDGAPLVSLPLQTARGREWLPLLLLWVAIPAVPLLGFWRIAEALETMMGFHSGDTDEALVIIVSVLITIGVSTVIGIPTSITLALVGALTGAAIGKGWQIDVALVTKVLLLGFAAPLIAALVAYLLSWIPLRAPGNTSPHRLLGIYRNLTFPALALAYAANDGQKVLFAVALVLQVGVAEAASMPLMLVLASSVFMVGVLSGLRGSGKFVRHGITVVTPVGLMWAETSTAATVIGGSLVGVPLSMTQSLAGSLLGVGFARSARAVYWRGMGRVGIAWVWTLPVAGLLALGGVSLIGG